MARARSPRSPAAPRSAGRRAAANPLDDLLPLAEPAQIEVHRRAAVLEVDDPVQLLEIASDSMLRPFLLCRLAINVALVDPGRAQELSEALRRRGHTPKISKP